MDGITFEDQALSKIIEAVKNGEETVKLILKEEL
jgi:hypothetical protein